MQMSQLLIRAMSKMGQHKAFWRFGMEEVLQKQNNIFVVAADLCAYSGLGRFEEEYPDRFINVGIQEQSMISVAAGLALEGNMVYTGSYAAFAVARPMEQIRNNLSVLQANVKIAGMCAGYNAEALGRSHWATEDIAMTRCLPGMTVISPADSLEAVKACAAAACFDGPAYIRLSWSSECPIVYHTDYEFQLGKAVTLRLGDDGAVIATGSMVYESLKAADILEKSGIHITVVNMHTVKPLDTETLHSLAKTNRYLFTVEEHNVIGGLGSAAAECLAQWREDTALIRIGMEDCHYALGERTYIWQQAGLNREQIAERIRSVLEGEEI